MKGRGEIKRRERERETCSSCNKQRKPLEGNISRLKTFDQISSKRSELQGAGAAISIKNEMV
jgi:hypothetical protein